MTTPYIYDRVRETTTTTGTGSLTLAGAVSGFLAFSVVGNTNTCYYAIVHRTAAEWETGIGTWTTGGTLARTTVIASSAGSAAKVDLSAGTKDVFISIAETARTLPVGYIGGFQTYNHTGASDTDHDIIVHPGAAVDTTGTYWLHLRTAMFKRLDATWAVGTGNGGRLEGVSEASNTPYFIHLLRKDSDGTIDVGFSTSYTAPTMPSGYTAFRPIASFMTDGSSNIRQYLQNEDEFLLVNPILDVDVTNQGTSATTRTLTIPRGNLTAIITCRWNHASALTAGYVSSPDVFDDAPDSALTEIHTHAVPNVAGARNDTNPMYVRTGNTGGVRTRSSNTNTTIKLWTMGWIDKRGRDLIT